MKDCTQRREEIRTAMTDLAGYAGPLLAPFIRLIDALTEEAIADLITIEQDKLLRKQGILAQLAALKNALTDPEHASPVAT